LCGVPVEPVDGDGWWDGRWVFAGPLAFGGVCVEVLEEVVELDDDDDGEDEDEDDDEVVGDELEEDELLLDALDDELAVVVVAGGHDVETLAMAAGRESGFGDTPGGSWKESCCPVTSVTVTVQSAAEATGSAASPNTVMAVLAAANATTSFRLLNTVGYLLPPCDVRESSAPRPNGGVRRTLLTALQLCNAELVAGRRMSLTGSTGALGGTDRAAGLASAHQLAHCNHDASSAQTSNPQL
jgi:hypothetical protein